MKKSEIIAKTTNFIMKNFTNCSALPGKMAYNFDKNILKKIKIEDSYVIFVLGTNGKSSITKNLYSLYTELIRDKKIISNLQGANMVQGILTTLLLNSKNYTIKDFIIVLEVDELTFCSMVKSGFYPNLMIINNLFEDQKDRYGSREKLLEEIKKGIEETILFYAEKKEPNSFSLLINGDEPIMDSLKYLNCNVYDFSVEPVDENGETILENKEKNGYFYSYINYGDLGRFNSLYYEPKSTSTFVAKYTKDFDTISFNLGNNFASEYSLNRSLNFKMPSLKKSIYNIYNLSASLSVFLISLEKMSMPIDINEVNLNIILSKATVKGRMEKFELTNGYDSYLNLAKNDVGFNLTLDKYDSLSKDKNYDIVFYLGNTPADGIDMSWISNVNLSHLSNRCKRIFICGKNSDKVLSYLNSKDFDGKIIKINKIKHIKKHINKDTYFVSNFSTLNNTRNFLVSNTLMLDSF